MSESGAAWARGLGPAGSATWGRATARGAGVPSVPGLPRCGGAVQRYEPHRAEPCRAEAGVLCSTALHAPHAAMGSMQCSATGVQGSVTGSVRGRVVRWGTCGATEDAV